MRLRPLKKVAITGRSSKRLFLFSRQPYSTRKRSVCMDGLEVNTAHCYTPVQKATSVDLATGKAIGTSVEQGQLYKRTNPSSALGVFCLLSIKSGEVRNQRTALFHPCRTVGK